MNYQQEYDTMSNQENVPPPPASFAAFNVYDEDESTVLEPDNMYVGYIEKIEATPLPDVLWEFASHFEDALRNSIYNQGPPVLGHGSQAAIARGYIQNTAPGNLSLYEQTCILRIDLWDEVDVLLKWTHVLDLSLKSMAIVLGKGRGTMEPQKVRYMLLMLKVLVPYLIKVFTGLGLEVFDSRFEASP
jgi:hypothetical protein